jgi:hypothetical protein
MAPLAPSSYVASLMLAKANNINTNAKTNSTNNNCYLDFLRDNTTISGHHSSNNTNNDDGSLSLRAEGPEKDNLSPVERAEIGTMHASVLRVHVFVQGKIQEFIRAKNALKSSEKLCMELEAKLGSMQCLLNQVNEMKRGEEQQSSSSSSSFNTDISVQADDTLAYLKNRIKKQKDQLALREASVKACMPLITLLGTPDNFESVMYRDGYDL